nr:DNA-directed RNA polymerase subunit beta'-like [Lytechinus pictus]
MINQLRALVQEAADTLFDKSLQPRSRIRRRDPISENTQSITDNLKGKSGRFRQNLLGKRVDFSAGSVIVGGPNLKLNECGLPRDIAVVLFRGAIIGELLQRDPSLNKRSAEKIINDRLPVVWNILSKLVKNYPVILNRAPTLHRLGVQGFYPKLIRGKAIQLHPLVTTAFNADFDGDRMPIHLPLTDEAKAEVESVLMSTQNILNPRNGSIILLPSQDIILGIYYLTTEIADGLGTGSFFANPALAMLAFEKKKLRLHSRIFVPANAANKHELRENNGWLMTTVGKLIFNSIFESDFRYLNGSE